MVTPSSNSTPTNGLSRGWRRMRELRIEDEAARQAVADGLVRDLGREPSTAELLLIETTAAQVVEARKLRRQGKSSEMQDRLVYRGLTRLGIKPAQPKPESLEDYLQRTTVPAASGRAACDESGKAEPNYRDDDERIGGHANGEATA